MPSTFLRPPQTWASIAGITLLYIIFLNFCDFCSPLRAQETKALEQKRDGISAPQTTNETVSYKPLWELGGGVGLVSVPHYVGSDQRYLLPVPLPYFIYRGEFLRLGREERRGILYESQRHLWDISAGGSLAVDSDDNEARQSMPDLPFTLQLGPRWSFSIFRKSHTRLHLRLPVRKAYALDLQDFREVGNVAELSFAFDWALDRRKSWRAFLASGVLFGDRNYFDFFYRVRLSEATPTRPVWRARDGYGAWDTTIALSKYFTNNRYPLWIGGFFDLDYLHDTVVADSPLVRQKLSWSAGLAIIVVFGTSSVLVPRDAEF